MANNKTADDKTLQTYPSPDGKRWIELRQRPDGMFYFQEFYDVALDDIPGIWTRHNYTITRTCDLALQNFRSCGKRSHQNDAMALRKSQMKHQQHVS